MKTITELAGSSFTIHRKTDGHWYPDDGASVAISKFLDAIANLDSSGCLCDALSLFLTGHRSISDTAYMTYLALIGKVMEEDRSNFYKTSEKISKKLQKLRECLIENSSVFLTQLLGGYGHETREHWSLIMTNLERREKIQFPS